MVQINENFTVSNGHNIRYLDSGEGFPLILVHGRDSLMSSEQWRLNMPALSEVAHVYSLDLLGYGKSDLPVTGYTFDTFVQTIEGFLESLNIEKVDICGQSAGGWFAALFAWKHPDRVRNLILVGNAGANLKGPPAATEWTPPEKDFIKERFAWAWADNVEVTENMVEEAYELARRPGRGEAYLSLIQATHDIVEREKYLLLDKLQDVHAPTLIIWGSNPSAIGLEHAYSQHEILPNSELIVVEDGGHSVQGIKPREFEEIVIKFLQENP